MIRLVRQGEVRTTRERWILWGVVKIVTHPLPEREVQVERRGVRFVAAAAVVPAGAVLATSAIPGAARQAARRQPWRALWRVASTSPLAPPHGRWSEAPRHHRRPALFRRGRTGDDGEVKDGVAMKENVVRIAVVVVDLFAAVSAIVGAIGLIVGYMDIPLSVLDGTPFTDFTVPALLLGIVVGGSALAAGAIAVLGQRRIETLATAAAGCVMVGWMTVEVAMIGLDVWVQAAYFVVGLLMIALAGLLELTKRSAAHHRLAVGGS